jgi:hypothetical protein
MRKLLAAMTVIAGLAAVPAAQASPHFLFASNSIDTSTGALFTMFKEAGLGTGTTSVAITLTADTTATYRCYNKAGNKPQGANKTVGPGGVTGSADFPVRNGQTTGTLVAGPLGPGGFSCPSGQILFLDAVSYSNTQVTDQFGTTIHATPDPISAMVHVRIG